MMCLKELHQTSFLYLAVYRGWTVRRTVWIIDFCLIIWWFTLSTNEEKGKKDTSMPSIKDAMMHEVCPASVHPQSKVTIVGTGQVGMAAAFSMMSQGVVSELALVDVNADKLRGEMMDLQHGQAFMRRVTIQASTDYAVSAGSKICVVTAGARQREGESRLDLVQRNVEIFKSIIPQLVEHSPDTTLVIVANPVDILTYVAWKLSGLPSHRVIGSGTMLDSSRFRFLISEKLNISAQSVHAYIIGEHGDSSVPVWSGVNVGGVRLSEVCPHLGTQDDFEHVGKLHQEVVNSAYEIIRMKGYTSWAIGLMVNTLCNAVLKNQRNVYPLSTLVKDIHGIEGEVFLSVPCVVGEAGISHVITQKLSDEEIEKLRKSAETLRGIIVKLKM